MVYGKQNRCEQLVLNRENHLREDNVEAKVEGENTE